MTVKWGGRGPGHTSRITFPGEFVGGGEPPPSSSSVLFTVMGDSLTVSRDTYNLDANRTAAEPEVAGAIQYVNYSGQAGYQTLVSDVSPLWHPDDGVARISPFEDFLREYVPLTAATPIMVPCGEGGSWLARPANSEDWDPATPGTKLVAAQTAHNAALALADPGTTVGAVFIDLTSNDYIGGSYNSADIITAWLALIDYVRANFDGVDASTPIILGGPCASGGFATARGDVEYAATQRINTFVEHPPYPTADVSNLHPTREENRAWGAALASLTDTVLTGSQTIPTFVTAGTQAATQGDQLAVAIDHTGLDAASKYGFVEINGGADAAEFEIGGTWPNQVLRWVGDGTGPASAGDYVVNLRIRNGAWEYGADYPVTVSVAAAGMTHPSTFFTADARGAVWDLSDPDTLFQDVAGTTPVTATGQSVGKVLDVSGKGNHWTAAADNTTRPTYQVDADGMPYLQFDGSNDVLFASTPYAGGTTNADSICDTIVGVYGGSQSGKTIVGNASTSSTSPFVRTLDTSATSATFQIRNDAGSGFGTMASLASAFDNSKRVLTSLFAGANATSRIRDAASRPIGGGYGNYTELAKGTVNMTITLTRAGMGANAAATPNGFFNGRIYSGLVINRPTTGPLTEAEIKAGEDWVAARQLTSALP